MSKGMSDSTIARIAGNLMSGSNDWLPGGPMRRAVVVAAVETARAIVAEIERTKPAESSHVE